MNTPNLNKYSESTDLYSSQPEATSNQQAQQRITAHASIDMPKKTKKAQGAFRTISEVADKLGVQQHVLRFWETKFSQVRPLKRGGGRRYYRPEDVALLERIHHLLYTEGYTIKGVQKLMKGQGKTQILEQANNENAAVAPSPKVPSATPAVTQPAQKPLNMGANQRAVLEIMLAELKAMRAMIKA